MEKILVKSLHSGDPDVIDAIGVKVICISAIFLNIPTYLKSMCKGMYTFTGAAL
jgi:hypothetical protein